jgi:hypothetical protein
MLVAGRFANASHTTVPKTRSHSEPCLCARSGSHTLTPDPVSPVSGPDFSRRHPRISPQRASFCAPRFAIIDLTRLQSRPTIKVLSVWVFFTDATHDFNYAQALLSFLASMHFFSVFFFPYPIVLFLASPPVSATSPFARSPTG